MPAKSNLSVNKTSTYVGRFAPSPSGPLHFGSLVAALGSYLQARKAKGRWFVRIEDIDPPREVIGASQQILDTLEQHSLLWDDIPVYQSQRGELYDSKIAWLIEQGHTYYCQCTRADLAVLGGGTLCACAIKNQAVAGAAIRFNNTQVPTQFNDVVQGRVCANKNSSEAQFAIKRKDGLYAYQLAVVVDDIAQGVTQVVRGADLLHATFYQLALYQAFGLAAPSYAHLPVVESQPGKKLSKQNHALALDNKTARQNIIDALFFLGLEPPILLKSAPLQELLDWALNVWEIRTIPAKLASNDNRIQAL
ncbi:tRNA glutamyl-Q(34) synthetase GluQRS [Paraglaciecola sp.]|uniref:tRNA glutamyl-Q(34) synthetase GluQRS n=1 Tax=Paraglaciecola sp. TaxID=1920173 RepID=UPI0030F47A81